MRKEIFKVGYQKPKSSPLQGIEPGSSCIVVLQLKKKQQQRFTIGGNGTQVFAVAKIVFTDGLHPQATAALSRPLAKNFVVSFTACYFFYLKFV